MQKSKSGRVPVFFTQSDEKTFTGSFLHEDNDDKAASNLSKLSGFSTFLKKQIEISNTQLSSRAKHVNLKD
jgi:hypothetical protein